MMALSALRSLLRVSAPINEMKEVLIHIRISIDLSVTKNVLNIADSTDPDERPRVATSHLDLRYL